MFKQFLYQAGGQLFNDNYEPVFYDTGMEVFDWIGRLQDNNVLPDGMSSMGEGGVGDTFIAGGLAMTEAWTPLGARVLNSDGWSNDRVGFAKPPAGPSSRATFQDTNGISVSAFSERKQAARKFAEFMTTPKSSKNNMLVEGNPSPHPEVYDDPEVQDKYPSKLVDMMKFNLENAKSETYLAQPQVDNFLSNELTAAFVGDKSPDAALKAAQSKITNLYKTSGIL
jgi:multiple sugar transport system substrate-binding protein